MELLTDARRGRAPTSRSSASAPTRRRSSTGEILEDEKILGTCPRRLRRLRRDRGHGPGAGPPRLRRDEADARARRRGDRPRRRAAGPMSARACRWRQMPLVAVPNFSEGRSERVIGALEATLGAARQGPQPPLRRPAQPLRLHDRGGAGQAGRGAGRRRRARDRPDRHAPPPGAPPAHRGARRLPGGLAGRGAPRRRASRRRGRSARGSPRSASPSSSTASWRASPERRRARLLPRGRPGGAGAADEVGRARAGPRARRAAPERRRDAGHRPGAAGRLQRGARHARTPRSPATIAAELREAGGGLPGVRALGLPREGERAQVSINIHDPDRGAARGGGRRDRRSWRRGHGARAGRGRAGRTRPRGGARGLSGRAADQGLRPRCAT